MPCEKVMSEAMCEAISETMSETMSEAMSMAVSRAMRLHNITLCCHGAVIGNTAKMHRNRATSQN